MRIAICLTLPLLSLMYSYAQDLSGVTALYVVGDAVATGWDRGSAPKMKEPASGVFVWCGQLKAGELKFLTSRSSWDSLVADAPDREATLYSPMAVGYNPEGGSRDYKWIITKPGRYGIVLNANNATLTLSDFSMASADAYLGVEAAEGQHKVCEKLSAGRFIITASDGAAKRYLLETSDGAYIYVDDPMLATVYRVGRQSEYAQVLIDAAAQTVDRRIYTPWESLYAVGSFNGWAFSPMTPVDGETAFKWEGNINAKGAEIKFLGADSYDPKYNDLHLHPYAQGAQLEGVSHIVAGGDDNKWKTAAAGRFSITVDPFRLTVKATNLSGLPSIDSDSSGALPIAVVSNGSTLHVEADTCCEIAVYTPSGALAAKGVGTELDAELPQGLYIVTAAGRAVKVMH